MCQAYFLFFFILLMATFMDAVSTIQNLLQSTTTVTTKCDSYYEVRQNTPPLKLFSYNPPITLTVAKSVKIVFSSIRRNELAWLHR